MNDKERIDALEAMLAEEREKSSRFLDLADSYARGLHMLAAVAFAEAPARTRDEANAKAIRQHAQDLEQWVTARGGELRDMMRRPLPAATAFGLTEAPEPPAPPPLTEDTERPAGVTIH